MDEAIAWPETRAVVLDDRWYHIDAEVVHISPVDEARECPIAATDVDDAADLALAEEALDEFSVFRGVLRRRADARANHDFIRRRGRQPLVVAVHLAECPRHGARDQTAIGVLDRLWGDPA